MKKLLTVLVLTVGFTVATQAQRGEKKEREKLTTEQQTELALKKMTLQLDLTTAQQSQIKPLITKQVTEREKMREEFKAMKKSDKKPTADERYAMKTKMLDSQIAHKTAMKDILNEQQYSRYEKMTAKKMQKHKKKGKRRGHRSKKHQDKM